MLAKLLRSNTSGTLADQAVVSGGNFLTAMVLARTLAPSSYGVFSLIYLAIIALNTCHSSVVVYPLTLRGAAMDHDKLGVLTRTALLHTFLLALPLSLVAATVAVLCGQKNIVPLVIVAIIAWQMQETVRRALIASARTFQTVLPDALCYIGQAVLLFVLHTRSLAVIFLVMAVTSLFAALWQIGILGVPLAFSGCVQECRTHATYAWKLGRYILFGNALNMIGMQIPSWTLAAAIGTASVAGFQSLMNLGGIANPIIFSINSLLIPMIARNADQGATHSRGIALRYGIRYGVLLVPCFVVLAGFPSWTMHRFYGAASPYLALAPMLRLLILSFGLQYIATVIGAYEGGMSRPNSYLWIQVASIAALAIVAVPLIYRYGIQGAVIGILVASAIRLISSILISWNADRQRSAVTQEAQLFS
jgi:O-antigen/teichoic acid export membrane protein